LRKITKGATKKRDRGGVNRKGQTKGKKGKESWNSIGVGVSLWNPKKPVGGNPDQQLERIVQRQLAIGQDGWEGKKERRRKNDNKTEEGSGQRRSPSLDDKGKPLYNKNNEEGDNY